MNRLPMLIAALAVSGCSGAQQVQQRVACSQAQSEFAMQAEACLAEACDNPVTAARCSEAVHAGRRAQEACKAYNSQWIRLSGVVANVDMQIGRRCR